MTNLVAKFSSTIVNFENENFYYGGKGDGLRVVADPTNPNNKVLFYAAALSRPNFGIPLYVGVDEGYVLEAGQKYEVSFKYYSVDSTKSGVDMRLYATAKENLGQSGGKFELRSSRVAFDVKNGEWQTGSVVVEYSPAAGKEDQKYLTFTTQDDAAGSKGKYYFDDIVVTKITEKEYTFNDRGVVTKKTATAGAALPKASGSYFLGWYDKSLTVKYDRVPSTVTELYARYGKVSYSFDDASVAYDPNNNFATNDFFKIAADPDNASNNVLVAKFKTNPSGGVRTNFALNGAVGANGGYAISKGQVYTISFKYKGVTPDNKKFSVDFYTASDAGIGCNGNKSNLNWQFSLEGSSEWVTVEKQFVLSANSNINLSIQNNLLFSAYGVFNGEVYIDDFVIAPYVPPVSTDDFVMDFEDDFKWSVADANKYTDKTGNGYVNRGELVEAEGNTYFRVKHFSKRNAYIYFTVDNGAEHFNLMNTGIYTIEFDYKIEHTETPATIGLAFVKPTTASTGFQYRKLADLASFGDSNVELNDEDWVHVSYSFGVDLTDIEAYTSLALYVYNGTNVPEYDDLGKYTATTIAFDNIVVHTHTGFAEHGMIVFDPRGGSACTPVVGPADEPVGVLPQPTNNGHIFMGWKYDTVDADGNVIVNDLDENSPMPKFITNAYATWKLVDGAVEITFRSNVDEYDANAPRLAAFPGKPIIGFPTEVPTAAGQKFVGWYLDTGFNKPVDPNSAPSESVTVYAKWESEGTLVDFEKYPSNWFNEVTGAGKMGQVTDRISIKELEDGNHVLFYDFSTGSNQANTTGLAGAILHTGTDYVRAIEGLEYTVTFKYKVLEAKASGSIGSTISASSNTWSYRMEQAGRMNYGSASDSWLQGSYTFTAAFNPDGNGTNNCYISLGVSNDCKIYIDDVVVTSSFNTMNVYGSAVIFNTNGGKKLNSISGEPGTKIDLPTPVYPGYKFMGWYTDKELTTPFTDTVYGTDTITLHAKWQLGKFTEGFEDYPNSVKSLGIAGAYSFYNNTTAGFDASNVHGGNTSLFRNGATAGVKNFTLHRSTDLAIKKGDTYTLSFYVKPTSIGDANGTISMIDMTTFTTKDTPTATNVISNVADLKEGEWNLVTYTFTATSDFIGISTTAGNDMYFDDFTVTLKGYTGSANTGDSSVNPIVLIALVILCAGALLITGKKVFGK